MLASEATVACVSDDWLSYVADGRIVIGDELEHGDDLRRRLAHLPFDYRLVLLLRGPLGVSWETTALVLGRSVHAAQCVMSRARRMVAV